MPEAAGSSKKERKRILTAYEKVHDPSILSFLVVLVP
jgi:hypothetical protein